ncbi:MAG: NAD-dependent epimerase/dehydratase family protein [bacterium]
MRSESRERAVVTGAAGFIGSHLCEALIARGHHVVGVDSFSDTYARSIKSANLDGVRDSKAFTFVEGDLNDLALDRVLEGAALVFHCAARAGVRTSWGDDFRHYVHDNLLATQRLLEASRRHAITRFVFTSSSSVYGDARALPVTEDSPTAPISPYGATKLSGEDLCRVYRACYGVPFVALRLFTVYGPRQRPDMAFHKFLRAVRAGRAIELFGDGSQTRDFTFVADAVRAIVAAASAPHAVGEVINIAGGSRVALRDVLDAIAHVVGARPDVTYLSQGTGEATHTFASIAKAERLLGYAPSVDLRHGLAEEHAWLLALEQRVRVEG